MKTGETVNIQTITNSGDATVALTNIMRLYEFNVERAPALEAGVLYPQPLEITRVVVSTGIHDKPQVQVYGNPLNENGDPIAHTNLTGGNLSREEWPAWIQGLVNEVVISE